MLKESMLSQGSLVRFLFINQTFADVKPRKTCKITVDDANIVNFILFGINTTVIFASILSLKGIG